MTTLFLKSCCWGRQWLTAKEPVKVQGDDFRDTETPRAYPYGIYDLARNAGYINVGTDHDTRDFAVASIRGWWRHEGRSLCPNATNLLITADDGGSNGSRLRLWKLELQSLANETGLSISVCHFPPGTSQWNKVEHRRFSFIASNWRGEPLVDFETIDQPDCQDNDGQRVGSQVPIRSSEIYDWSQDQRRRNEAPQHCSQCLSSQMELRHKVKHPKVSWRRLFFALPYSVIGGIAGPKVLASQMTCPTPIEKEHGFTNKGYVVKTKPSQAKFKKSFAPHVVALAVGLLLSGASRADWENPNGICHVDAQTQIGSACSITAGAQETCDSLGSFRAPHRFTWIYHDNDGSMRSRCSLNGGFYGSDCEAPPGVGAPICTSAEVLNPATGLIDGYWTSIRTAGCNLAGGNLSSSTGDCTKVVDLESKASKSCPAKYGNPIEPLTGSKTQTQDLGISIGMKSVVLGYDTKPYLPYAVGTPKIDGQSGPLLKNDVGGYWRSNLDKRLELLKVGAVVAGINLVDEDGSRILFSPFDATTFTNQINRSKIVKNQSGDSYIVVRESGDQDVFFIPNQNSSILPVSTTVSASGSTLTFQYSSAITTDYPEVGLLTQILDDQGHSLTIKWVKDGTTPVKLKSLTTSGGGSVSFTYASTSAFKQLDTIVWPDGSNRKFLHENVAFPWALTGIVDEMGQRASTYTYDTEGYAVGTNAGGVNSQVSRYVATYGTKPTPLVSETYDSASNTIYRTHTWSAPDGITIQTPNGQVVNLTSSNVNGWNLPTSQSQPAGSGCAASNSSSTYDQRGNRLVTDDFSGNRTCYAYDASDRVVHKVEGLSTADACPAGDGTPIPTGSRLFKKQRTGNLVTAESGPSYISTKVYNGLPDPFNGMSTASCMPAGALMPDGSPIAALCKEVVIATTNANGSLGFSATADTSVLSRVTQFSYDVAGNLLSTIDPSGRVTSFSYVGNALASITNAKGQQSQIAARDGDGRVVTSVDINGNTTAYTYNLRGKLTNETLTTPTGKVRAANYNFNLSGELISNALPDGSTITYSYDAFHRLVSVTDSKGNSISYTLDNAGNRVLEQTKDATGAVMRTQGRVFDSLNRLQQFELQ